jgi:hypothetical protein
MEEKLTFAKKIGNFASNILLGDTKEMIIRTDEKVKYIGTAISDIKTDIRGLADSIAAHGLDIVGLKVHTKYGENHSPTIPGELGSKLLQDSGFGEIYPELKPKLFGLMEAKNLRTLYDYEKGAEKALKDLQDDPLMDYLKEYSVSHPDEPLEVIFKVASWVIRDDYATSHPVPAIRSGAPR